MKTLLFTLLIALPVWASAQVTPAWRPFLEIKPDEARVQVVKALATDMNPESRKLIVGALMDPYRPVVDSAKAILTDDHCSATFWALVAGMPTGSQYEAALILSTYKEPRYIRAMARLLRHDRIEVRRPVALAMGHTDSRLALEPLERARNDPDPHVRCEIARALGRLAAQGP